MTIRKQQMPVEKRAQRHPPARTAARRRPGGAGAKAARGATPARRAREDAALTLAAQCTLAEAESLKSELARRLEHSGTVIVDTSALERIDTAGLQLLAAFVRDRRMAGRAVQWRGPAGALESAAALLGLGRMLELTGENGR